MKIGIMNHVLKHKFSGGSFNVPSGAEGVKEVGMTETEQRVDTLGDVTLEGTSARRVTSSPTTALRRRDESLLAR